MTGRFVWYELMTSDPKKAIDFYTEVVGWKTQPFTEAPPDKPYTMWVADQGPIGGVMEQPEEARKQGAPPFWMSHVEVADVDRTIAQVKELGGKVHFGPQDIPTVGRFAVIADPYGGAILSVFKPTQTMKPHDTAKAGEISWNELYSKDHAAALKFYGALFGWKKKSEMDMGPAGKYVIFGDDAKDYGGMMDITGDMVGKVPPSWTYYIQVDDLDGAIERAKKRDAKLMMGPIEVPGGTRVAQLTDPLGGHFALHGK